MLSWRRVAARLSEGAGPGKIGGQLANTMAIICKPTPWGALCGVAFQAAAPAFSRA